MRDHSKPPHTRAEMRVLYPVFRWWELAAGWRDTTERGGQVADRRIRVTRGKRCEVIPALDELEDGHRLILVIIDGSLPDEGGDHDTRDAERRRPTDHHVPAEQRGPNGLRSHHT